MKKVLFASTALASLAIGSIASAQGITLFGDARLGLGYNINSNGSVSDDDDDSDLSAVSRVRFGVNMTGETDSGIVFGATVRADNAEGGEGSTLGQTAGNVFVSGDWGTLTLGDTNGADEQWVGDIPGNLSLTGLGDLHETFYISNGGNFGSNTGNSFAANPDARPTIRYDFDLAGFGFSLSSDKKLGDIGIGAGYAADFAGGSWGAGIGYYNFQEFTTVSQGGPQAVEGVDIDGDGINDPVLVQGVDVENTTAGGQQLSLGITGDYENFGLGLTYTNARTDKFDSEQFGPDTRTEFQTLGAGVTVPFDRWTLGAYYHQAFNLKGELDGGDRQSWGLTGAYDLGGGAQVAGGVVSTFGIDDDFEGGQDRDSEIVGDFGIKMSF